MRAAKEFSTIYLAILHSKWTDGIARPTAVRRCTLLRVRSRDNKVVKCCNLHRADRLCPCYVSG